MQLTRFRELCTAALAGWMAFACAPRTVPSASDHVRFLHSGVAAYREKHGRLPVEYADVCKADPGWCRQLSAEARLLDPWSNPVRYSAYVDRYELRSAGADGRFDTQDDVFLDSRSDLERADNQKGCFRLPANRRLGGMSSFRLTTTATPSGLFAIAEIDGTIAEAYSTEWHPIDDDSLRVLIVRADAGFSVRGRLHGDTLRTSKGNAIRVPCA